MTDAIMMRDGEVLTAPKVSPGAHGWIEHHDEAGGIIAMTPPQRVDIVLINIESNFDFSPDELHGAGEEGVE